MQITAWNSLENLTYGSKHHYIKKKKQDTAEKLAPFH